MARETASGSPEIEKFSRTSNFLENLENFNEEFSKIEESFNIPKGELMVILKKLKQTKQKISPNDLSTILNNTKMNFKKNLTAITFFNKKTIDLVNNVKLEDMLTLNYIESEKTTGNIKKMLHAPTLKIFTLRVINYLNRKFFC